MRKFVDSINYDIMDQSNMKHLSSKSIIEEQQDLNELIELHTVGILTLKQCYKGGGIIILINVAYLKSCYDHFNMTFNFQEL